jgi:hypothetical protein
MLVHANERMSEDHSTQSRKAPGCLERNARIMNDQLHATLEIIIPRQALLSLILDAVWWVQRFQIIVNEEKYCLLCSEVVS